LFALDTTEHVIVITIHHIVSDGWSMGVLVGELTALYAAHLAGSPSPLQEPTIQYADFARWQRAWLAGPVLDRQGAYWRRNLADAPFFRSLPTDRPRPEIQTYNGATVRFTIPASTPAGLHAIAQQEQATIFMVLVAAFNVLLSRYSGQLDISIGTFV